MCDDAAWYVYMRGGEKGAANKHRTRALQYLVSIIDEYELQNIDAALHEELADPLAGPRGFPCETIERQRVVGRHEGAPVVWHCAPH